MIDKLTREDIGKKVIYHPRGEPAEEGFISSFNDFYVFVRFGNDGWAKSVKKELLDWPDANDLYGTKSSKNEK